MAKMRSPNYPAMSLKDGIEQIRKIWDKEKRTPFTDLVAVQAMGYTGLNGPARTKLSALKKYGLLTDAPGGKFVLPELALKIILSPADSIDYKNSLQQALIKPEIFSEFYNKYADSSDKNLKSTLLLEYTFSENGANHFISVFRDNLEFAKLHNISYNSTIENHQEENNLSGEKEMEIKQNINNKFDIKNEGERHEASSFQEGTAVLKWPGKLSKESTEDFVDWLDLLIKKVKREAGIT